MIVTCKKIPMAPDGSAPEASAWVSVGGRYRVVSVLAEPGRSPLVQIVTDDRASLAWFDSTSFETVDGTIPASWTARIGVNGALELAPSAWLASGFWEAYYDGDPVAARAVETELQTL